MPQTVAPPGDLPTPDYEQPAISGEAPAEFTLLDEFAEPSAETAAEPAPPGEPSEPDLQSVLQLDMPFVEASHAEPPAETATPDLEIHRHEPSPYVEAVADEPAAPAVTPEPVKAPSWLDEPTPGARRHPLRFMWQMDAEGRFSLGSDEFTRLIGARTAAGFGRLWSEIAETFGLDPDGRVAKAVATGSTWSGITLNWPVDGGGRLPVELSGLPIYDHTGKLRRLSRLWGVPRSRRPDAARRVAPLRVLQCAAPRRRRCRPISSSPIAPAIRPPRTSPDCPPSHRRSRLNCPSRLPSRLHNKPIWKRPWKRQSKRSRTSCRFARSANRNRLS